MSASALEHRDGASTVGVCHARVAYGRNCEALRGVATRGDRSGPGRCGKLHVEDGIGPHRRSIALDRAGSGLERLVLLGKSGTLTLESLAWLRAIGVGLIHLGSDGHVLTHSVPFGYDGHPMRRAQALAVATGLDIDLARELIHRKLDGQRLNLVSLRVADLQSFDAMSEGLDHAASIDEIRLCEAKAAAIYWNAWSTVPIRLRGRDLTRVPVKWTRYDSRGSALTNGPRAVQNEPRRWSA
jgi:hypothetical protein